LFQGKPEDLIKINDSYTSQYLKKILVEKKFKKIA